MKRGVLMELAPQLALALTLAMATAMSNKAVFSSSRSRRRVRGGRNATTNRAQGLELLEQAGMTVRDAGGGGDCMYLATVQALYNSRQAGPEVVEKLCQKHGITRFDHTALRRVVAHQVRNSWKAAEMIQGTFELWSTIAAMNDETPDTWMSLPRINEIARSNVTPCDIMLAKEVVASAIESDRPKLWASQLEVEMLNELL